MNPPITASRSNLAARKRPRTPWRSLARAASWHRRKLAVLAAVAAVLCGVAASAPDGPPTVMAVRANGEIPAGTRLTADQLTTEPVSRADAPEGLLTEPGRAIGRTLAAPVAEGQMLTELALVSPRARHRAGLVSAPLRLADSGVVALLRPGDVIDVLAANDAAETAHVLASRTRVVTVPAPPADTAASDPPGSLVLVEVSDDTAAVLARAAVTDNLTITWP